MAQQLDDVAHLWGSDLQLSPTGDLARVNGQARSEQRVLRRVCTNPKGYASHPSYGGGAGQLVGAIENDAAITARLRSQMLKEASVAPVPAPTVALISSNGEVTTTLTYIAEPDKQPVALSFSVVA